MTDPRTIKVYDEQAEKYENRFDKKAPDAHLTTFMDHLPKAGTILDLGCGTGGSTAHMVERGFVVTGMDASEKMLEFARAKSDAHFIQGTFDDLDACNLYDGIWANFSLLHAPREAFPKHLGAIHSALKPAGFFHLGMKTGDGAARDNIDRFYTYYAEQELKDHLSEAGFEIVETSTGESPGLAGNVEPWMINLARRIS